MKHYLKLYVNGKYLQLDTNDIMYCKADSNYTHIVLKNNQEHLICKTLKEVNRILNNQFIRVHQTYLINTAYIISADKSKAKISVKNDTEIPVSRRKKKMVFSALML